MREPWAIASSVVIAVTGVLLSLDPAHRWLTLGATAVAIIAVLASRRAPLVGGLLIGAGMSLTATIESVPAVLLFGAFAVAGFAGASGRLRNAAAAVLPIVVLGVDAGIRDALSVGDIIRSLVSVCVVAAIALLVRRRQNHQLDTERVRSALVIAEARNAISRDLHDIASHALLGFLTQVRVARRADSRRDAEALRRALDRAESAAKSALGQLRELTTSVARGADTTRADSVQTLREEMMRAARYLGNVALRADVPGDALLDPAVAQAALRVFQQCITNAASHAPGETVTVRLSVDESGLRLLASNPAPSASCADGLGLGLRYMAERVEALGGTIETSNVAGRFTVSCTIPRKADA